MKDMKIKDIVMKVIDVLYNIIVGVLTILGKVIVFFKEVAHQRIEALQFLQTPIATLLRVVIMLALPALIISI